MFEHMKIAYANSLWIRIAAFAALVVYGIALLVFGGGFPPWSWRFLLQTLPQIPTLLHERGPIVCIPLVGLVLLSLALFVLWIVFATAWLNILVYWYQERKAQQHCAEDLQEARKIAAEETMQQPVQQSVQQHRREQYQQTPLATMSRGRVAVAPAPLMRQAVGDNRTPYTATMPLARSTATHTSPKTQAGTVKTRVPLHVVPSIYAWEDDELPAQTTLPEHDYEDEEDSNDVPIAEDSVQKTPSLRYIVGVASDAGIARKHMPNEDNVLAIQGTCITPIGPQPVGLFVVADGMGGHANGREASRLAIQAFSDVIVPALLHNVEDENIFADLLKDGVHRANLNIYQRNRGQEHMMGTTITAALLVGEKAYIANVGDSRTYIYRHGKRALAQVTRDHSHVALLVEKGDIARDDIYTHPRRNQIYRCLGEHSSVQTDLFEETLTVGDALLLCSDGLWEMVRDPHPGKNSAKLSSSTLSCQHSPARHRPTSRRCRQRKHHRSIGNALVIVCQTSYVTSEKWGCKGCNPLTEVWGCAPVSPSPLRLQRQVIHVL